MKKKIKAILFVLFAVFTFSAAFAMSAVFATEQVVGIKTTREQNYEAMNLTDTASSKEGQFKDSYSWCISERVGAVSVGTSFDGNQYMIFTQTEKVASVAPYFGTGYGGVGTTQRIKITDAGLDMSGDISNYPYLIFDFDVMSPTGKYIKGANIDLQARSIKKGTTKQSIVNESAFANAFQFGSDSNGSYVYINTDLEGTKKYLNPYEFNHITVIYESVATETARAVNAHFYINGEHYHSSLGSPLNVSYYNDIPHMNFDEIRFMFPTTDDKTQTLAFDNVVTRLCDSTYNGNLKGIIASGASLSEWESNIYDADNMPGAYYCVYNETTDSYYRSLEEAILEADDGNTLKVNRSFEEEYTVDKELIINSAHESGITFELNIKAASGYTVRKADGGIIRVENDLAPAYEYISGGEVKIGTGVDSLKDIIAAADAETVVKITRDLNVKTDSGIHISKKLTLDLGGNTLTLMTANKVSSFSLSVGVTFKIQNGTLISEYYDVSQAGSGYPVVSLAKNSTLSLDSLNTFTSCIAWSYASNGTTVNVRGGEHHIDIPAKNVCGAFVESRANMTFVAEDAVFYCGSAGNGLISSLHYKVTDDKLSTFTYNNCKIISESPSKNIVNFANEFTKVYFNNCYIQGSIQPKLHSWEITNANVPHQPAGKGAIVLGEGTRLVKGAILSEAVVTEDGCELISKTEEFNTILKFLVGTVARDNCIITEKEKKIFFDYECVAVDEYTVKWYSSDGKTVIRTDKVPKGQEAVPPEFTEITDNGWFNATFAGWSTVPGGVAEDSFVINKSVKFYPSFEAESVEADIIVSKHNVSLLGNISINFYLPDAPECVSFDGVFDALGNEIFSRKVYIEGKAYNLYSVAEVGAAELLRETKITVKFSVGEHSFEVPFAISPYSYLKNALEGSGEAEKQLSDSAYSMIADMVRYSNEVYKYLNYTVNGNTDGHEKLEKLILDYGNLASEIPDDFSDLSEVDVSDLSGYVTGASLEVSNYSPAYKFYFAEDAGVVGFYVTIEGYDNKTYVAENVKYFDGTKYFSEAYIQNVPMYDMCGTVKITAMLENGVKKCGSFNLNAYYSRLDVEDAVERETVLSLVKSMKAFCGSAYDYKFESVITAAEEKKDFRICEHSCATERNIYVENALVPVCYTADYCAECDSYLVYYSDYGVVGDGITNDFASIRRAHIAANDLFDVAGESNVVAVSGEGTFYIGKPDDGGAAAIAVYTNVNWNGAHFIIDDTVIDIDGADYSAAKQSIFLLTGDTSSRRGFSIILPVGITEGATNIGFAPGEPLMIKLTNTTVKHYIRYGLNQNSGANQNEMIIVDAYGNIDPSTPVQWDYNIPNRCTYGCTVTDGNGDGKCDVCNAAITRYVTAYGYTVSDKPIVVSGLDRDGNINCIWETRTNSNVKLETYNQYVRNINICRSNTVVEGIDRVFVEDNTSLTPRQTYAAYVNVSGSYNTVIKDMLVCQHLSHYQTNGALLGSYEFGGGSSVNTSWINCRIKNFFKDGGKVKYSGMFGTNYMRNSYLKGCVLTSFDSHSGAHNVTIEDSTFEHINYVGGGQVIMKNVTVYVDGGLAACILRQDYGSMWKGDIYMDGITLRHSSSYSKSYIDIVKSYYTNWYFGFTSYLPGEIYVNDVKIEQYKRTSADYTMGYGTIDEPNLSESTKKLGVHQQINAQMKNDYDYSVANDKNLDPKVCTKTVYINNSNVEIAYPNHWFFDDMTVYVDGVKQDWFNLRKGLHSDANSDGVCDNGCGQSIN